MYDSVVDFAVLRRVAASLSVMEPGPRDRFCEILRCISEVEAAEGRFGGMGFLGASAVMFVVTVGAVVGMKGGTSDLVEV